MYKGLSVVEAVDPATQAAATSFLVTLFASYSISAHPIQFKPNTQVLNGILSLSQWYIDVKSLIVERQTLS